MTKKLRVEFYEPVSAGSRTWGEETVAALVPGVATLKILRMKAGYKGRLQKHHVKDEAGHLLEGTLIIRYEQDDGVIGERTLAAGASFYFPPGAGHQEEAVTDCVILEVSSPHGNDREGLESKYGLPVPEDALPTTNPEDVIVWEPWWK